MIKSGIVAVNEIWEGDIHVTGDVFIPEGVTVTVAPGCVLRFSAKADYHSPQKEATADYLNNFVSHIAKSKIDKDKCHIVVQGVLNAVGNPGQRIAIGNTEWGGGILIISEQRSTLKCCVVSHAACGIFCGSTGVSEICGNEISHCSYGVISMNGSMVRENEIHHNALGVLLVLEKEPDKVDILRNTVLDNADFGIFALQCNVNILDNIIRGNGIGINMAGCQRMTIARNDIEGNRVGIYGLHVNECDIAGNRIRGNRETAILNHDKIDQMLIRDNKISGNANGIDCQQQTSLRVSGNMISDGEIAFKFGGQSYCMAEKNTITGMTKVAVMCEGNNDIQFLGNEIQSVERAIKCSEESRIKIVDGHIESTGDGVAATGVSSVEVLNTHITSKQNACVRCGMNASMMVRESVLRGDLGVDCAGQSHVNMTDTIIHARQNGVVYREQSRGVLEKNVFYGDPESESIGVSISGMAEVEIKGNDIKGVSWGIQCVEETHAKVTGVRIESNRKGIWCSGVSSVEIGASEIVCLKGECVEYGTHASGAARGNNLRGAVGLVVGGGCHVVAAGNALDVEQIGIVYKEQSNGVIEENKVHSNAEAGTTGINVLGMVEVEIKGNEITGVDWGIRCLDGTHAKITGMRIESNRVGIWCGGVSTVDISGNQIVSRTNGCIEYEMNASGTVKENTLRGAGGLVTGGKCHVVFTGNVVDPGQTGAIFKEQSSGVIENNVIQGNAKEETTGIGIFGMVEVEIKGNEIKGVDWGIRCLDGTHAKITGTHIRATREGVWCSGISTVAVNDSDIASSEAECIELEMNANSVVRGNRLRGSVGLTAGGNSQVTAMENILHIGQFGIICKEQSSGVLGKNMIDGATEGSATGINISGVAEVKLDGNDIKEVEWGVRCLEEAQVKIAGGRIKSNRECVWCSGVSNVEVTGNELSSSLSECVAYVMNACGSVRGNRLRGAIGVVMEGSSRVAFAENCLSVEKCGVRYREQSSGVIEKNEISGCLDGETIGIEITGMAEIEVRGNEIKNVEWGIWCLDGTHTKITGVHIESVQYSLWCSGGSSVEISGSDMTSRDNECARYEMNASGSVRGNRCRGAGGVAIGGNSRVKLAGNTLAAEKCGIMYKDQSGGIIEKNAITGSAGGGSTGIEISGVAEVEMSGNDISVVEWGIRCSEEANVKVADTNVRSTINALVATGVSSLEIGNSRMVSELESCILIEMGANGVIHDNEVKGNVGMELGDNSRSKVKQNVIEATNIGMKYSGQAWGLAELNTIRGEEGGNATGIDVLGVVEAEFTKNTIEQVAQGIQCDEEAKATLTGNQISSSRNGVWGMGTSITEVIDNTIESENCVGFEMNATGKVEGNTLRGGVGIEVGGGSRVNVVGNVLEVRQLGIGYWEQSGGVIERTKIEGKEGETATGIDVAGVVELEIRDSEIAGVACGVRIDEEARIQIDRLTIDQSRNGMEIGGHCAVNISGNAIKTARLGIRYHGQSSGVVESCIIDGQGNDKAIGVNILGMAEVQMRDNTICGVTCGINCDEESNVNILDERISAANWAVEIKDRSRANIRGNSLESGRYGVICRDESLTTIEGNRIKMSPKGISCGINVIGKAGTEINNNDVRGTTYGVMYGSATRTLVGPNRIKARKNCLKKKANALDNEDVLPDINNVLTQKEIGESIKAFILGHIRALVLRSWHYPGCNYVYRRIYRCALFFIQRVLRNTKGIKAVYVRRGMASGDWVPGLSDIDLFAVIDTLQIGAEKQLLRNIGDSFSKLKKVFPFIGELQIATEPELRNYFRWGDIRSFEAHGNWKLLSGVPVENGGYVQSPGKLQTDAVTELLHVYGILSNIYFDKPRSLLAKHVFVKAFIDFLKYARYLEGDRTVVAGGRLGVLNACLARCRSADEKEIVQLMKRVREHNASMGEEAYKKAFLYIFDHLERMFRETGRFMCASDHVPAAAVGPVNALSQSGAAYDARYIQWKHYCEELKGQDAGGLVQGIIMDDPGPCCIIVNNTASTAVDFSERMAAIQRLIQEKNITRRTRCLVMTPVMYQAVLLSLHFENPFYYFKLPDTEGYSIAMKDNEERLVYNVQREQYAPPTVGHLEMLAREAVTVMSISIRMFERMVPVNNLHKIIYLYTRILSLQLFLEKGVITEPYLENVLTAYEESYPECREWLERLRNKYLLRPAYESNALPSQEVFDEHYPFLAGILGRLNNKISEDVHAQCR